MSETSEVRRLLDEKGVTDRLEYEASEGDHTTAWDVAESKEHPMSDVEMAYVEYKDGVTITRIWNLTPEQVVAISKWIADGSKEQL